MKEVLDVIGIGFGPANLSVAVALEEQEQLHHNEQRVRFFERKKSFEWHPDMLLNGATVQVSFLKDLVTLRNPQSRYTFLNFLHQHGRLEEFVNLRSWFPSRLEFQQYFAWVADHFRKHVSYETDVRSVSLIRHDSAPLFQVVSHNIRSGKQERSFCRNLVLACGGSPYIPDWVRSSDLGSQVCHSNQFLSVIKEYLKHPNKEYAFAVAGRGQSAAEIAAYLLEHFPRSTVTVYMRGFAFKAADDTEFINEIFFNSGVDFFFDSHPKLRSEILDDVSHSNYSAVDTDLLRPLYRMRYEQRVKGEERLYIRNLTELVSVRKNKEGVAIRARDRRFGHIKTDRANVMVLATGYRRTQTLPLLEQISHHLVYTDDGQLAIDRYCEVETKSLAPLRVFLQGESEGTHGITSSLLSVLPFRSAEIAERLLPRSANDLQGPIDVAA